MAGFYYTLGRANCDVIVYGTTIEMDRKSQTHLNEYWTKIQKRMRNKNGKIYKKIQHHKSIIGSW